MHSKTVYIHQPNFMPWLGFFEGLYLSDTYVIYDDVAFEQYGYQNRCKIKSGEGEIYLTVPVKNKFGELIKDKRISENYDPVKVVKSIYFNYKKCVFFDNYYPSLEALLTKKHEFLIDLNISLILFGLEVLNKKMKVVLSSQLSLASEDKSERVLEVCKQVECDSIYVGTGAKEYLNTEIFDLNGVRILYNGYEQRHPSYRQNFNKLGFLPFLSYIDMLLNCGEVEMCESIKKSCLQHFDYTNQ